MNKKFNSVRLLINILSIVSVFSIKYKFVNVLAFSKNILSQSQLQMCTTNSADEIYIDLTAPRPPKDLYKDHNSNQTEFELAYMKIDSHPDKKISRESFNLFRNAALGEVKHIGTTYDHKKDTNATMNFIEEIGVVVIGKASEVGTDVLKTYAPMISSSIQTAIKSLNIPSFQNSFKKIIKSKENDDTSLTNTKNTIPKTIGTELDTFLEEIGIDKDFYEKFVPAINSTIRTVKAIATEISKQNTVEDNTCVSSTLGFDQNTDVIDTHSNIESNEEILIRTIDCELSESNEISCATTDIVYEKLSNSTDYVYDNADSNKQILSMEKENENNSNPQSIELSLEPIAEIENQSLISLNNALVSAGISSNNIKKTNFKTLYTLLKKSRKAKSNAIAQSSSTNSNSLQNEISIKGFSSTNFILLYFQKIIAMLRLSHLSSNNENNIISNKSIKVPYHLTVIMFLTIRPLKIYNFFRSFRIHLCICLLIVLGWNIYNVEKQLKADTLS